jgi:hypothetical protein
MATRERLTSMERAHACAICERTILLGEEPIRFAEPGRGARTVCLLCAGDARQLGWIEEGRSAPPPVAPHSPRGLLRRLAEFARSRPDVPADDPIRAPRGLGVDDELRRATTMVVGVETFNDSPYRGTVSGIAKSLGQPRVSVVAFGGRRPGAAVTIAWDLCWYRYLVEPGGVPQVRLDERGDGLDQLGAQWRDWNARALPDGSIELDVPPPDGPSGDARR